MHHTDYENWRVVKMLNFLFSWNIILRKNSPLLKIQKRHQFFFCVVIYHMAYFIKFFKMSVGWDPDNDKNYTWLESEHRRRIIQKKRQRSSLLFEAQNVSIPCRASYFALGRFRRIGFIHPFLQIILVQFISSQNSSDDLYLFFCNYPSSMDQNHCTTKGIILMCRCFYYYLLSAVIILCRRKTLSFSFLGSERWLYRKS